MCGSDFSFFFPLGYYGIINTRLELHKTCIFSNRGKIFQMGEETAVLALQCIKYFIPFRWLNCAWNVAGAGFSRAGLIRQHLLHWEKSVSFLISCQAAATLCLMALWICHRFLSSHCHLLPPHPSSSSSPLPSFPSHLPLFPPSPDLSLAQTHTHRHTQTDALISCN